MSKPEEPPKPETPENAWRSQPEEPTRTPAPDELCAMARSRERLNVAVTTGVLVVLAAIALALLYNVYRIDQPWLRLGQAWTLGVIVYIFGPMLERRGVAKAASEPCAHFLQRQHEERRLGYLRIRRRVFLLIPGMAASWWGGGLRNGNHRPLLFIIAGAVLVLDWFLFGKAAEKAARDRQEIERLVG